MYSAKSHLRRERQVKDCSSGVSLFCVTRSERGSPKLRKIKKKFCWAKWICASWKTSAATGHFCATAALTATLPFPTVFWTHRCRERSDAAFGEKLAEHFAEQF